MSRTTVYNDNLTQDWDNVSAENKQLILDFLKYCKSADKSPATLKQYEEWLKVFFCWNYKENQNKFFINLKKRDFVYYFGWCRDLGMSANRIATLKSVLSSLSSEIELLYEDVYPSFHNQLRGLEAIHISTVRDKTVIDQEQMDNILKGLIEKHEYQIACYLALLCASGARKAEMLQMQCNFFIPENEVFNGYMYATPKIRTKGHGKQGKMIKKYVIKDFFQPYLNLWLEERKKLDIHDPMLFVTKRNGVYIPANISTANSFAAKISQLFNIDWYNHAGRHYFATLLKRKKFPDDIIVQIFGWADSAMLKIYNDISPEEIMGEFFDKLKNDKEVKGE